MIVRNAVISPCKNYRYSLSRQWEHGRTVGWIMLNPSTADDLEDDPTIRRCMGFAMDWGYAGIEVCNLFAYRATNPNDLSRTDDPTGPENDEHLRQLAYSSPLIVAAWGAFGFASQRAANVVGSLLKDFDLHCLGINQNGSPKHPLYVPKAAKLVQMSSGVVQP